MPELSVVVPVLNEAAALPALLSALARWRGAGDEVIVADGGSTDASLAIAGAYADRVVRAPRGRARQMNAGAALAKGEALLFVHADTRLVGDARGALARALAHGAQWGRFDVRIDDEARAFRVIEGLMNLRSRVTGIATGDQGIFVRRRLFEQLGGYPDIALMEDVELCAALRRRARPACLPRLLATSSRRWRRHGIARTVLTMWALRLAHAVGASPERLARVYAAR